MEVRETLNSFSNENAISQISHTVPTFGNQATSNYSGFGRQNNSIFGTFANQNHEQNQINNNFFQNQGHFQPCNFGFGNTMTHQTTEICFTGFGEADVNYSFSNSPNSCMKKVTLIFKHPETNFGTSIFRKPDTIVEIETHPTSYTSAWTTNNNNDFSFNVGYIAKYDSAFVMKSLRPMKFCVQVKESAGIFSSPLQKRKEFGSSWKQSGNRKITLTFKLDQPHYEPVNSFLRPFSTIIEMPVPLTNDDPTWTSSNEGFMFSVGPTQTTNSFEVQTSKQSAFKITFSESDKFGIRQPFGNQTTGTGPLFFDQGRQLNRFPSGFLFGQSNSALGGGQLFGNSSAGFNAESSSQSRQINATSKTGGLLFGQSRNINCQPVMGSGNVTSSGSVANQAFKIPAIKFGVVSAEQEEQKNTCESLNQPNDDDKGNGSSLVSGVNQFFGNNAKENSFYSGSHQNVDCSNIQIDNQNMYFNTSAISAQSREKSTLAFSDQQIVSDAAFGNNINHQPTFGSENWPTQSSLSYQPSIGSDIVINRGSPTHVNTKTNCITAMKEYSNKSLEELRLENYIESGSEKVTQFVMPGGFIRPEQIRNHYENPLKGNLAISSSGRQWAPYSNSLCNFGRSTSLNSQLIESNDTVAKDLYNKTKKHRRLVRPNENKTINEFYEDVFKYLDFIQTQYSNLENTLSLSKNKSNITENHSKKSKISEPDETNQNVTKHAKEIPMPVFGSACASVNTSLLENNLPIVSENTAPPTLKKTNFFGSAGPRILASSTDTNSINSKCDVDAKPEETNKTLENQSNDINIPKDPLLSGLLSSAPPNNKLINVLSVFPNTNSKITDSNEKVITQNSEVAASKTNEPSTVLGNQPYINIITKDSVLVNKDFKSKSNEPSRGLFSTTELVKKPRTILNIDSLFSKQNSSLIKKPDNLLTFGSIFQTEAKSNEPTISFVSSKDLGNKPENILTLGSLFQPIDFKSKASEPATGAFASTELIKKPPTVLTLGSLFTTQDSAFKKTDNNAQTIDTNLEYTASKVNEPALDPGVSGKFNFTTLNEPFKFVFSKEKISKKETLEKGTSEEKTVSDQQKDIPMDDITMPSQAFKMQKIREELDSLEEDESDSENKEKRKDSLTKSDTGSDISNFTLISNHSLNEDDKDNNSSSAQFKVHPTGIVMTRSGYYTLPPLEDLKSLMTEDGRCMVSNYIIGRKGYGSICFPKEINVACLNVDDIVHFRNKEVIIYPNSNNDTPADTELNNIEVLVTLEQVWPHDKTKHEPIKDPQRLDVIKYEDKLRLVCDKNDIHFVEYNPEVGSWVFKMMRFTKRNINCWDEEDEKPENESFTGTPEMIKMKQPERIKDNEPPKKKFFFELSN